MNKAIEVRYKIVNIAIALTLLLAVFMLAVSFIPSDALEQFVNNIVDSRRMVRRVLAVVLILTTYNLYKRKRVAWLIAFLLIALNFTNQLLRAYHGGHFSIVVIVFEAVLLGVFIITAGDFSNPSDKKALKIGFLFVGAAIYAMFLSASSIYFDDINVFDPSGGIYFGQCLGQTLQTIFIVGNTHQTGVVSHPEFETFVFWFSWVCIIVAVGFSVKPFLAKRKTTSDEFNHARELVKKYGQNPLSYLNLEDDKTLYFGKSVDGVVAYGTVEDVVVVNGDPICADEDFPQLLEEFKQFCKKKACSLVFMGITDYYLDAYKKSCFGTIKCGEEARFDLTDFTMQGGKIAKVRASVNKATKSGISVFEYCPLEAPDKSIEAAIEAVSNDWLKGKNSGELAFTLGGVGLENPLDKRYFCAKNEEDKIVAFIVFVPFAKMDGYLADVTRRSQDAPAGVNELIMVEAFKKFKEEGIHYATMGLAPLANLSEGEEKGSTTTKMLEFIYENLNEVYGFKNLYRAKVKYNPFWVPGYFAFMPKIMTPKMAYAIVKIQNPQGMVDYAKAFVAGKVKKEKAND